MSDRQVIVIVSDGAVVDDYTPEDITLTIVDLDVISDQGTVRQVELDALRFLGRQQCNEHYLRLADDYEPLDRV